MTIAILYASQNGNSKYVAELIKKSIIYGYEPKTIYNLQNEINGNILMTNYVYTSEIDDFDLKNLQNFDIFIFVVPTYGDGDEPFKMRKFWRFLRNKNIPNTFLKFLKYFIYGLGDSSYTKFNFCAKKLNNRLLGLGARNMGFLGLGDSQDDGGILKSLDSWVRYIHQILTSLEINHDSKNSALKDYNVFNSDICLSYDNEKMIFSIQNRLKQIFLKIHIDEFFGLHQFINRLEDHFNTERMDISFFVLNKNVLDGFRSPEVTKFCDGLSFTGRFNPSNSKITKLSYMTPENYDRKILNMELNINTEHSFFPGDCIAIKPKNYNFEEFLSHNKNFQNENIFCEINNTIHVDESIANDTLNNTTFVIEVRNEFCCTQSTKIFVDNTLLLILLGEKIQSYIKSNVDYNFQPNQHTFLLLHEYCKLFPKKLKNNSVFTSKRIISRILEIGEDYDTFYQYIVREKRTFFEVIKEFGIILNYNYILQFLPNINFRYFTTAFIDNRYQIYVSLVDFVTKIQRRQLGLCSEYLKSLLQNQKLNASIGTSNLSFSKKNMLFFATGTGIVLPWSCINHFQNKKFLIFYGFRYRKNDRLFQKELPAGKSIYNKNEIVLIEAPSQEYPYQHVQNLFKNYKNIELKDYDVYVCGNTNLNKEIRSIFLEKYNQNINFQSETW